MQLYNRNLTVRGGDGKLVAMPGATVHIRKRGSSELAALFSDNGATSLTQPLTTDANGYFPFYAANGEYTATISSPRFETFTWDIELFDADDVPQLPESITAMMATQETALEVMQLLAPLIPSPALSEKLQELQQETTIARLVIAGQSSVPPVDVVPLLQAEFDKAADAHVARDEAFTYAANAETAAANAALALTQAQAEAGAAAQKAGAAQTAAGEAAASASAAGTKATEAAGSATAAANSASQSHARATDAATSATSAAQSNANAANAAAAAEQAKIDAQLARNVAHSYLADAQLAQGGAQSARDAASSHASYAFTQAQLATSNGAAQVELAKAQAQLATTNGAAQVELAKAQVQAATASAQAAADSQAAIDGTLMGMATNLIATQALVAKFYAFQ